MSEGRLVVRLGDVLWPRRGGWKAKIVEVRVSPGARVRRGDVILEVEVEKAVIEVESPVDGVVVAVYVSPGDEVGPGDPVLEIEPIPA